uniref:Histone-lysine N-methyltransferase, H3 lysine-9 specific n=1 Tax=Lygus hesperus TaxID=30085 RepID=A0A0A9WPW5_LYGHE
MVDAMLRARKEYEKEQIGKMGKDGVLLRKNSYSDDSISTDFVPPTNVLQELEELKRSLGGLSPGSSSPHHDQEPDREFVERLLAELLTKRCTPEEVIQKIRSTSTWLLHDTSN